MSIVLTAPTGKLGNATLTALLTHSLLPPSTLILSTSSPDSPKLSSLPSTLTIRPGNFNTPASLVTAFTGARVLFLVSTPAIDLDFNFTPYPNGRESQHIAAIEAAREAGVTHIVYTSLGFNSEESGAGVMRAHLHTHRYLREKWADEAAGRSYTILREGLYAESWPLYLGHADLADPGRDLEGRREVPLAGDGRANWVAIEDLGVANAVILAEIVGSEEGLAKWRNRIVTLSTRGKKDRASCGEIAEMVRKIRGEELRVKIVGEDEHVKYYTQERGVEEPYVRWWVSTYPALENGECENEEDVLEECLAGLRLKARSFEEVVGEMVRK
ncbi:NAD(P)-binding protein [Patellaria atrata CBS 101060]|uniref:NAD(P)-binding protein n=1 Tax=Patellaria atrata CBS 101060 TaxID=1346257 RepID=A0A9P4VKF9_9PEZI|nr:NAD(P)-binding protein [Patellaria atrata CBS 101060]